MGYKILDVKADIHEDVKEHCRYLESIYPTIGGYFEEMQEGVLNIVDKHFEKIER